MFLTDGREKLSSFFPSLRVAEPRRNTGNTTCITIKLSLHEP